MKPELSREPSGLHFKLMDSSTAIKSKEEAQRTDGNDNPLSIYDR